MSNEKQFFVRQEEARAMGVDEFGLPNPAKWTVRLVKNFKTRKEAREALLKAPKKSYYKYETNA